MMNYRKSWLRMHHRMLIGILLAFAGSLILFKSAETNLYLPNILTIKATITDNQIANLLNNKTKKSDHEEDNIIQLLLEKERHILKKKFQNYTFHPGLNVSSLVELIPELGGRPLHNLVISTWRSGTTFLGELLTSYPGSFYHYEPLLPYGINQLRYETDARPAVRDLHKLMNCDYTAMDHFINFAKSYKFLIKHTPQIYNVCEEYGDLCYEPRFLGAMCKVFPFQQMKVVRLRARYTEEFLSDKKLRTKVLLLVRDPRATLQSRKHRNWCPENPDCYDPEKLCNDMLDDYYSAKSLSLLFKKTFRVIRYEDASFDIYNKSKHILNFFNLNYHSDVEEYLDSHTKTSVGGVSSTFRNSKTAPIHWKFDLTWKEVADMQMKCKKALSLWGYKIAINESHLRSFNPIGNFDPKDMNMLS